MTINLLPSILNHGVLRPVRERIVIRRSLGIEGSPARLYVTPDSQWSYLKPRLDFLDELVRLADRFARPGDQVWDIGANLGVFSLAAALRVGSTGTVVGLEPDTRLLGLMRKSAGLREYSGLDIRFIGAAASARDGMAAFQVAAHGRASNSLVQAGGLGQMGGVRRVDWVPTVTLDRMADQFGIPDLVKIDVEGAELDVLNGAKSILANGTTVLFAEVGNDAPEVASLMSAAKYVAWDLMSEKVLTTGVAFNTLFLPPSLDGFPPTTTAIDPATETAHE